MNAQYHIDRYKTIEQQHEEMLNYYRVARLFWGKVAEGESIGKRADIEYFLQKREQAIARFEWKHGIFS